VWSSTARTTSPLRKAASAVSNSASGHTRVICESMSILPAREVDQAAKSAARIGAAVELRNDLAPSVKLNTLKLATVCARVDPPGTQLPPRLV